MGRYLDDLDARYGGFETLGALLIVLGALCSCLSTAHFGGGDDDHEGANGGGGAESVAPAAGTGSAAATGASTSGVLQAFGRSRID